MINLSDYSCDKCAREFSRHCKHCLHTAEKPPTRSKKKKKTGVQTPEFRRPSAPPPPPTSGSNAQKPRTMIYSMKPEDLKGWVNTKARIGDIAYYHDHISGHQYIYCYRKPDDNPIWCMMQPELLTDYLQKESEEEREMEYKIDIDAMIKERLDKIVDKPCPYETPCGWCTKWDKKCDNKIGCDDDKPKRGLRANANVYDESITPCVSCEKRGADIDHCCICWAHNFNLFKLKETDND